jgi:hypothetical protein
VSDDPGKFSKLFSVLNEGERKQLTLRSKKQRFEAGDVICREGETEADFFVITRGSVTVSADDFGTPKALATLTSWQFFGELAALGGQPRQATVVLQEHKDERATRSQGPEPERSGSAVPERWQCGAGLGRREFVPVGTHGPVRHAVV